MNDTTVTILLGALLAFCLVGAILFADRWKRAAQRIADSIARISDASRAVTDAALATVRAEVTGLLDVQEHVVTARCERSLLPGHAQTLYTVIVVVRMEPTEAMLDTLVELEQSVRSRLPKGAGFTIDARPLGQRAVRMAA